MNHVVMPYIDCHEVTQAAIRDVLAQTVPDLQLLLVANGGTPLNDSVDARVRQWHHQPPMPSLSATWNMALRFVWEAGGQHALVVNNDVRLPTHTYATLLRVLFRTGAWFVSATNVGEAYRHDQIVQETELFGPTLAKGGPDFSCFLITKDCHQWFQFDEQFIPAYHEDNDYHRRLELAGFTDQIFSVCVPYLHYGSATINRSPEVFAAWPPRFVQSQEYYKAKWGGLPGKETFVVPFNQEPGTIDTRVYLTGEGRPGRLAPQRKTP